MKDEPTRYQPVMPGSPDHADRSMPAEVSVGGAAGADTRRERLRAAAAHLRPAVAVLSQPASVARGQAAAAQARWRLPNGTERSGALTTVTVPAISYAPAGTSVRVWLDRFGEPVAPPPSPGDMIFNALFAGITATACSAVALILCYLLCRMVLDRHRLARWESAWAAVGPRWTSRR